MRPNVLAVSALFFAAACTTAPPGPDPDQVAKDVNAVADTYLHSYLDAFPESALAIGARDPHPSQLGDHSLPALKKWGQREDELLAKLKKIDIKAIDGTAGSGHVQVPAEPARGRAGLPRLPAELWNVSPTWTGWQADLPLVAGMQATAHRRISEDALARWSQVPK